MRGEDLGWVVDYLQRLEYETPPHAWRRLALRFAFSEYWQKHLHMRGEDRIWMVLYPFRWETPPHAWRRPRECDELALKYKKHLHMRGEDLMHSQQKCMKIETPPHAWRRLCRH